MKLCKFLSAGTLLLGAASPSAAFRPSAMRELIEKDLPNGAVLSVNLVEPQVNASFLLNNENTMDLPIHGNASVGKGVPDVAYIYIIDTSASTLVPDGVNDTSLSTLDPDGGCDSVLDCIQKFFIEFHKATISDGSAELTAVINFDDTATLSSALQDPVKQNKKIIDAINSGNSSGFTNCAAALDEAAKLVQDPSNTAGTTVVVFAGDGECDVGNVTRAADALGDMDAITHTIAVGDAVDCTDTNDLNEIPRNGGQCFSIPDPKSLPDLMDNIIGTTLESLEFKVDDGNYTVINNTVVHNVSKPLPQDGAISVNFTTLARGLVEGSHEICVRANGTDALNGSEHVEDCRNVFVVAQEDEGLSSLGIFLLIAALLLVVGVFSFAVKVTFCRSKAGAKQEPAPQQHPQPSDGQGEIV